MDTEISAAPTNLDEIPRKQHYIGTVVKTTLAGAIVNIGLDVPGIVHISQLQKDPVNRVEDVVQVGQEVEVWVRRVFPNKGRIELTMIKPLELDWRDIEKDMVLKGKIVRLEKFGVFVEIGAERPGLVHISEMTHGYIQAPSDVVKEGDDVDVKVLDVDRKKKQIKLSMKALEEPPVKPAKVEREKREEPRAAAEPEVKEDPVPTAMEAALRAAMDKVKTKEDELPAKGKQKSRKNRNELENILSRTLEHKVRTKQ